MPQFFKPHYVKGGLVLYLPMDDIVSGQVLDVSGQVNHGSIYGASAAVGKRGMGLSFDGINDYVEVINAPIFTPFDNYSVSLWAKIDITRLNWQGVISFSGGDGWGIYASHVSKAFLYTNTLMTGATNLYFWSNTLTNLGEWIHYVLTKQGTVYKWYINGELNTQQDKGTEDVTLNTSSVWGIGFPRSGYYIGFIDEVRIYNRTLSAGEAWYNFLGCRDIMRLAG